jgi:hypothetical protein
MATTRTTKEFGPVAVAALAAISLTMAAPAAADHGGEHRHPGVDPRSAASTPAEGAAARQPHDKCKTVSPKGLAPWCFTSQSWPTRVGDLPQPTEVDARLGDAGIVRRDHH